MEKKSIIIEVLRSHEKELLQEWQREGLTPGTFRTDLVSSDELKQQMELFFEHLLEALEKDHEGEISQENWKPVRSFLADLSRSRARQGFTPTETALFVFSLKRPIFRLLQDYLKDNPARLGKELWNINALLDKLGLFTTETYIKSKEEIIRRQQEEMLELSTPVVKIWEQIVAVPLIGTLDSARTQTVMENLLQEIVNVSATVAIIDITGVPTVDTLVAQHLIKTVSAARLMGTECIISGIRPQIAQTMIHLGVSFQDITTKATLAEAIKYGLSRVGYRISRIESSRQ